MLTFRFTFNMARAFIERWRGALTLFDPQPNGVIRVQLTKTNYS